MDAALLAVSMGQRKRTAGRAILGKGGGATRRSRVAGLLHAKGFAGVQVVLSVDGGQYESPGHQIRLPTWWQCAVALLAGSLSVQR